MLSKGILTAFAGLAASISGAFTLGIVHVNDTHSRVEPAMIKGKPYGGYARMATIFKQIRATEKDTVFLHAGDVFQGTLYFNIYHGLADGFLLNKLQFDCMTLGNHEFDNGPEGILPYLRQISAPVISSNLDLSAYPELQARVSPFYVKKVGRETIGFIGTMTPELPQISSIGNVKMKDQDACIEAAIAELEKQKINKIILISHSGYEEDRDLASKHPKLDVIVGGHSHTFLGTPIENFPNPAGPYPTVIGSTLIVQSWEWEKSVGHIRVDFDRMGHVTKWSGAPIPVDEKVAEDPEMLGAIAVLGAPLENLRKSVVGDAANTILRGTGDGGFEMPMGNIIADSMLEGTKAQNTVIALMNPGGVRATIEPGPITFDEAISVQPFNNTLVVMDLTGQEIVDALLVSLSKGGSLQISTGLKYSASLADAAHPKITAITLNGAPLKMDAVYRCVVNNFMARGGDGLVSLQNAKGYRYDTGNLDIDALVAYFKSHSPITGRVEGRITITK